MGDAFENDGHRKIGRYVIAIGPQGFDVRESSNCLTRLIESLMGRTGNVKLRLGLVESGPATHELASIRDVFVRRRRLFGPEAKRPALARRWEVGIRGTDETETPVFFRFRYERDARLFANAMRRELARLRNAFQSTER